VQVGSYSLQLIFVCLHTVGGNSPIMRRFPDMGRCIISYQEVLRPELKNVYHLADEVINCNYIINGQLLKTSLLTTCFYLGAL
jgi:hypothetical protein